eukprot:1160205-Pelagomonas_calceolata.AAC.1
MLKQRLLILVEAMLERWNAWLLVLVEAMLKQQMLVLLQWKHKGRDASARLTRSLKAQKLRDSIPETTEVLKQQLEEWTAVEGTPFLYDGHDYMMHDAGTPVWLHFEKKRKVYTGQRPRALRK